MKSLIIKQILLIKNSINDKLGEKYRIAGKVYNETHFEKKTKQRTA